MLPDYQGVGIGYKFLNMIAELYTKEGYDFTIVTSAKNLITKLAQSKQWGMYRLGISTCSSEKNAIDFKRSSMRSKCKTAGFRYKG